MDDSLIQRILKAALSQKLADDMEAESRSWMLQCPDCKYERSIWEIGGIRWKAAGNPRMYRPCPNCGKTRWLIVYRKTDQPA